MIKLINPYHEVHEHIDKNFESLLDEVITYVRRPGCSQTGESMDEIAQETLKLIKEIGCENTALVMPYEDSFPIVYGLLRSKNPNAKTMIIYQHYDIIPFGPLDEWKVPPLGGKIVDADFIGLPSEIGKIIVNRGVCDYRAALVAFTLTVRAMLKVYGDVPLNLMFCLDGEEEIGDASLPKFRDMYLNQLKTASAVYEPVIRSTSYELGGSKDKCMVYRGYKGGWECTLVAKGGEWGGTIDSSGLHGNDVSWVDAPIHRLIKALATMYDENQNPAIEGFYDNVYWSEEDLEQLDILKKNFDEEKVKNHLGIKVFKRGMPGKELLKDYCGPTLNISGIKGGYAGYSETPMRAEATVSCRLVKNMKRAEMYQKFRNHLDKHGFKEIEIKTREKGGNEYSNTSAKTPLYQAVLKSLTMQGYKYEIWPTWRGSIGAWVFNGEPLNLPFTITGPGAGGKTHQPNEYVAVEGVREAMKYYATFLNEYANI